MATRNRYAEIMAQYAQSQPFSFTSMPSSYTGGFTGYPSDYTGGFTPYQRPAPAPVNRYANIIAQGATNVGGGGQTAEQRAEREAAYNAPQDYLSIDRYDPTTGTTVKDVMSAAQLAALSPEERAMHIADVRTINPYRTLLSDAFTKAGILPAVNSMYENFRYGDLGKPLAPGAPKAPVRDVLPGEFTFANGGFISTAPSASTGTLSFAPPTEAQYGAYLAQQQADAAGREYGTGAVPPTMTQNQFAAQYAAYGAGQQPAASTGGFTPYSGTQNAVRSYDAMGREISPNQAALSGASVVVSDARSAAEAQARADAAAQDARVAAFDASRESTRSGGGGGMGGGGAATGGRDTGGGARDASGGGDRGTRGGFAQGGHVSMMHLQGPNPMGPDDGYAALKDGEFVINDKAVKKYGIELMNLINSGKISKGKLRGLLEM